MTQASNIGILTYKPWDPRKSLDFFTKVLGFYPQLRGDLETSFHLLINNIATRTRPDKIFVGCSETLIEWVSAEPGSESAVQNPNTYVFGVVVDDLEGTLADVEANGGHARAQIADADWLLGRQVVIDVPGGPQISLCEHPDLGGPPRGAGKTVGAGSPAKNIGVFPYFPWQPEETREFLTNALGFYTRESRGEVLVGCGDTLLQFHEPAPDAATFDWALNWSFGVVVENLEDAIASAESHGSKVARPIWAGYSFWGRQVVVTVPGGPQISLREYRNPDGPGFDGWFEESAAS